MKKIFCGVVSALMMLTACETIRLVESPDSSFNDVESVDSVIFTASLGVQSKTYLEYNGYSYKTMWSTGDNILIWDAACLNEENPTAYEFCSITAGSGTEVAEFAGTLSADAYIALYAYEYYYPKEGMPSIELPMSQYLWIRNGECNLGDNTYPMIAVSDSKHFEFQNPCSILKVSITGNDEYLESVTVSSSNGEPMSGKVVFRSNGGEYEMEFYGETEEDGVYSWVDFYAGAYLSDEPVDCYIVVPAQYYSGGLDFYVQTREGIMTVSTGSAVTTTKSKYYDVAIEYETEIVKEPVPDGVYHVPTNVTLTYDNASEYVMTETTDGRYEKFGLIYKEERFNIVTVDDGDFTYFAGYDYSFSEAPNFSYVLWQIDLAENSDYSLQTGQSYFYHIVLEADESVVDVPMITYLPTPWSVRGTFNNWTCSYMELEDYTETSAVFAARDIEFSGTNNRFKFDYSGNWSLYPNSEEYPYFEIVTNLGCNEWGDLVFGGNNIYVNTPGIYDIVLTWDASNGDLSEEYSYELIYKGDAAAIDYSYCQLELVGTSLVGGSTDTSLWEWGNVVLADNYGYPTYEDGEYKWQWTYVTMYATDYILEYLTGTPGFKVRTVNAEASGGIPAFDLGAECLDYNNSYYGVQNYEGNIAVDSTYTYGVVLTINPNTGVTKILVCLQ